MHSHPLTQLTLAKLRELLREPEALFWVFAFPVLMTLALGVAFRSKPADAVAVGVQRTAGAEELVAMLREAPDLEVEQLDEDAARTRLRTGAIALVVIPGEPRTYWLDPTRPDARLARLAVDNALFRGGTGDAAPAALREVTDRGSRYIDFLVPGLLGMNLMGTGMWGLGFSVVVARSRHMLKRMVASPMRRSDYLLSQILGRLVFLLPEVAVLVGFSMWLFEVPMRGSWWLLGTVCLLGAMTFAGLGLLVAARPRTIEGVSGLMNVVMLPMWLLSGTFFSSERFPDALQPFVQALPLTAVNDALRAVMLEGATAAQVAGELAIAAAWGVAAFVGALALFRWS